MCGSQATPFTVPEKLSCCNVGDTQTQQALFIQQIYPWSLFLPQHKPWEWITAKQNLVPGMTPVKSLDLACSCLASMNDYQTVSRMKSPERRSTVFPLTKSTWCQRNTCCWLQNRHSAVHHIKVYKYIATVLMCLQQLLTQLSGDERTLPQRCSAAWVSEPAWLLQYFGANLNIQWVRISMIN